MVTMYLRCNSTRVSILNAKSYRLLPHDNSANENSNDGHDDVSYIEDNDDDDVTMTVTMMMVRTLRVAMPMPMTAMMMMTM